MQHPQERESLLASLRYLEMSVITPLEIVADVEPADVAEILYEMAEDHQRHQAELELLLGDTDHRVVELPETFREQVAYRVKAAEQTQDEDEALRELIGVERFGAARYEEAIRSGVLDDQRTLLARHLEDERRHERYLRERVRGA